jgi:hypothetical protein
MSSHPKLDTFANVVVAATAKAAADGLEAEEPLPPLVHRVHDEVTKGKCPAGRLRGLLRDLSPNDLHALRRLSPPVPIAVARAGSAAELLLLRHEFAFDWWAHHGDAGHCLHAAAGAGNVEAVELLLAYSGDEVRLDEPSKVTGRPALHFAAGEGRADVAGMLLAAGASVEGRDAAGDTALHHACRGQHQPAAMTLMRRGADLAAMNRRGHAPWAAALDACDLDLLELVYTPATGPGSYLTAAQYAAGSAVLDDLQTTEVLRVLQRVGERLDTTSTTGVDVYHLALRKGKRMAADFVASVVPPVQVVPLPFRAATDKNNTSVRTVMM